MSENVCCRIAHEFYFVKILKNNSKTMNTVSIYSTPTCVYCNMAKTFFKTNNITYTENDVSADLAKRKEMIDKTGQMGVPVIEINGEVIIGFDEEKIRSLLGVK